MINILHQRIIPYFAYGWIFMGIGLSACQKEEEPCIYTPEVMDFFIRVTCAWNLNPKYLHPEGKIPWHPITKWVDDPRIKLFGQYTKEDSAIIKRTIDTLNAIQHQIRLSLVEEDYNFEIHVLPKEEWVTVIPTLTYDIAKDYGGWFRVKTKSGNFDTGDTIVYAYNVIRAGNYYKDSVLKEELIQALGMFADTYDDDHPYSIFHDPTRLIKNLSETDKLIISFFYSEHVVNGDTHEKFEDYVCWK
jgi:hypothetical protein